MAYSSTTGLIQIQNATSKAWVTIPPKYMAYESYTIWADQALDLDSYRTETGKLWRQVLDHTATKVEYKTSYINSTDLQAMLKIIKDGYISKAQERKVKVKYYDPETDGYKTGEFYRVDIEYPIRNVDQANNMINYDGVRVAFVEY